MRKVGRRRVRETVQHEIRSTEGDHCLVPVAPATALSSVDNSWQGRVLIGCLRMLRSFWSAGLGTLGTIQVDHQIGFCFWQI